MSNKGSKKTTSQVSKHPPTGNGTVEEHEINGNEIEKLPSVPTGDLRLSLTQESPSLRYLDAIRMSRLIDKLILLDYTSTLPDSLSRFGLSRYSTTKYEISRSNFQVDVFDRIEVDFHYQLNLILLCLSLAI